MIGACLEIADRLREESGVEKQADFASVEGAEQVSPSMPYVIRIRELVQAVASEMATPAGVIDWQTGGGDGGLFKGILVRYLAEVAVRLPGDTKLNRATKKLASRLVIASAHSVWNHRLEVDGLPVFAADWTADAKLPRNTGPVGSSIAGAVTSSQVPERDLSVQLSGWMLMEAAAKVSNVTFGGNSEVSPR